MKKLVKFPLSTVSLETAIEQYRGDLLIFFKGRFGRPWVRSLKAAGGHPHTLRVYCGPPSLPSLLSLERIAVGLGFRPYVGRIPNPFERTSRTYWPRLIEHLAGGLFAPTCKPSTVEICAAWMKHRSREKPHSDVRQISPLDYQRLMPVGNGIDSPMPAPVTQVETFIDNVNDNGDQDPGHRTGDQTDPHFFAQSSPRAIRNPSRGSLCPLQNESLTASCL
jgi:hypothetical protein